MTGMWKDNDQSNKCNVHMCTTNGRKSAVVESSAMICQGDPTSYLLFTLYSDHMLKLLKMKIQ